MMPSLINSFEFAEMMRVLKYKREKGVRPAPSEEEVNRVKRNLFGVWEQSSSRAIFEKEMAAAAAKDTAKWGFDFIAGKPTETGNEEYVWQPVPPPPPPQPRIRQTLISDFMGKRKKAPEKSINKERPEKIARTTTAD